MGERGVTGMAEPGGEGRAAGAGPVAAPARQAADRARAAGAGPAAAGGARSAGASPSLAGPAAACALCLYELWYQGAVMCRLLDACSDAMRPLGAGAAALAAFLVYLALHVAGRSPAAGSPGGLLALAALPGLAGAPLALSGAPAALALSCALFSLATTSCLIGALAALSRLDARARVAAVSAGSLAFAALCAACSAPLPGPGGWLATAAMGLAPLGVCRAVGARALPVLREAARRGAPADVEVTQPESFLSLGSRLFVALVLLGCAVGSSYSVMGRLGVGVLGYQLAAGAVLAAALALPRVLRGRAPGADALYWASIALAFVGLVLGLLEPLGRSAGGTAALLCDLAATLLFYVVMLRLAATVAARNPLSIAQVATFCVFAVNLGTAADGLMWLAANALRGVPDVPSYAVMLAFLILFVCYNLLFLHGFSFEGTAGALRPPERVELREGADAAAPPASPAPSPEFAPARPSGAASSLSPIPTPAPDPLDKRADRVAERFGLTAREADVARLLARGYSGAAIQERLVVSRNTVKTHVRNVYGKLGVHSQQELIDLVERG